MESMKGKYHEDRYSPQTIELGFTLHTDSSNQDNQTSIRLGPKV